MKHLFTILSILIAIPVFAIDPITGPTVVCAGSAITLSDATAGGTWSSSNPAVATVGASSGIVTGTLSASSPGTATITYSTATETATMDVTVNPTPVMTSVLTPAAICDSTLFSYTPTSSVAGTTFAWLRPFVPGIGSISVTATGPIMEYLDNSTYVPLNVPYYYTLTAGGCSNTDTVTIIVQPKPILTTHTIDTTCSGIPYNYIPMSGSALVSFAWSRLYTPGITNPFAAGSGSISETLVNTLGMPLTVSYFYTMSINGCTNSANLMVTVLPCVNSVATKNLTEVAVYPNPATREIAIDHAAGANVSLVSLPGNAVLAEHIVSQHQSLDVSGLPAGMYYLQIRWERGTTKILRVVKD